MGVELFVKRGFMIIKMSLSIVTVALGALLCLPVSADDKEPIVRLGDEMFIKNSAESGLTEVRLSELATQKALLADVKEFAQMLVTDHSMLNEGLKALASSKNLKLSAILAPSGAAKDMADAELKAWINGSLPSWRALLDKAPAMLPPAPALSTTIPPT
jgi:predicted outer membrane protein